jgi:DNA-binding MarR family transcriptional regulator
MSTASSGADLRDATSGNEGGRSAGHGLDTGGRMAEDEARTSGGTERSADALASRAVAFSNAFERWSGRKALEAGATIPRLHLMYAVHCRGPLKMADLAETLMVTPRNVTALVDGLEADGLVRRVPHSTDRRVTLVELTCESSRVTGQFEAFQASVAELFAGLDERDRTALDRLFETLTDRIRADSGCPSSGDSADA